MCAIVSLIADVGATFALSAFVGGTLVSVASTDAGTSGGTVVIASVVGVIFFLLSLSADGVRTMIVVIAIDSQREEEEQQRNRCYR